LGEAPRQLAQRIGVLERSDRAITGKRTGVSAGGTARADQARVERVVARVDAHVRVGRDPDHPAAVDVGHAIGQRPHDGQLLRESHRLPDLRGLRSRVLGTATEGKFAGFATGSRGDPCVWNADVIHEALSASSYLAATGCAIDPGGSILLVTSCGDIVGGFFTGGSITLVRQAPGCGRQIFHVVGHLATSGGSAVFDVALIHYRVFLGRCDHQRDGWPRFGGRHPRHAQLLSDGRREGGRPRSRLRRLRLGPDAMAARSVRS
jgi:hypothetical protein